MRNLDPVSCAPGSDEQSICAVVILAGVTGRLAAVRDSLARNLFDLPKVAGETLLANWCDRFAKTFGRKTSVPVFLAVDQSSPMPTFGHQKSGLQLDVNHDAEVSRGTAGILRDLAEDFNDDDHVLVVQASDLAWDWSMAETDELLTRPGDVIVSVDCELRPAGFIRVRSGLLRRVPSVGFVDLKEQFLPRCATSADVRVMRSKSRKAGSLHSLRSYLTLLGFGPMPNETDRSPASAIPWHTDRAVVEAGANVDTSAILFDSVVLAGAKVGRGAVIVRSLIGRGVTVAAGEEIVDRVLAAPGARDHGTRDVVW